MDTNKVDLKNIWQSQNTDQGNLKELSARIDLIKKSNVNKKISASLILVFTSIIICMIWLIYNPKMVTSKIGIILIISSILFFIFSINKNLFSSQKKDKNEDKTNKEYLKYFINLKEEQKKIQTDVLNKYFLVLFLGILLLMYEFATEMDLIGSIIAYTTTVSWLSFVWWYIKPRIIKNQNNAIENMIKKLSIIQEQFNTNK